MPFRSSMSRKARTKRPAPRRDRSISGWRACHSVARRNARVRSSRCEPWSSSRRRARVAAATRARLRAELHGSHLDDLTRAFRRETEWHALNLEIDRSRRGDGRFVLAFLDIDDLKGINDRAGHAAGDLVLRTLVATLRSSLRSFDPIVRFGGDEFVCGIGGADIREVESR